MQISNNTLRFTSAAESHTVCIHPRINLSQLLGRKQLHLSSNSLLRQVILSECLLSSLRGQEEVAAVNELDVRRVLPLHAEMMADIGEEIVRGVRETNVLFERELLTD